MNPLQRSLERLYTLVADEEDARVCKDISDEACKVIPGNFFAITVSNSLTKLGDAMASPKTVLAWLLAYAGAPLFLTGLLVPIRESGSLLPQLVIASFVRRMPIRKWVWVAGSLLQFLSIAGIAVTAATLRGALAGWVVIVCLTLFSLSRGLSSVSSKDVLGKTIPKTRRGRLTGISGTVSGILTVGLGLFLVASGDSDTSTSFYGWLLLIAALLWLAAALVYSFVKEFPGSTEGGKNAIAEAFARLDLLRTDLVFRRFVLTRALFLCSALMAPYFVVLAQEQGGTDIKSLGLFVAASGLASSLSATVWGFMADVSSKRVLIRAATLASSLGVLVFLVATFLPALGATSWAYPAAFFALGIAHAGVRAGRKTYIVDMAGGNKRTDYVAVSNTAIGVILLFTGLAGALATFLTPAGLILLLSLFGFLGVGLATTLPEVE